MHRNQVETDLDSSSKKMLAYKWKAFIIVALGTFMGTMDASITNISFPILTKVFDIQLTTVMWVTLAYMLTSTSLMLVLGKAGDQMGRKRLYATGMLIFSLGLFLCSLSRTINQLIICRVFQAVGAAMTIACSTAIVADAFPAEERGKGLGLLGSSVSAGFITGPILGGILLEWLHWRSIFYVRIPLGLLTFVLALMFLKKDEIKVEKVKLDYWGMLSSSIGLLSIMFGVSQVNKLGLYSPIVHFLIVFGLLCLIIFVLVERNAEDPVVDLSLFKNRVFSSAIWSLFLTFMAYPVFVLVMPFYLMQGIGLPPLKTGMLMAVVSMTTIVVGPISGWLSDRSKPVWISTLGAVATLIAYLLMCGFDLQTQIVGIIPVLILYGFGVSSFHAPNNSSVMGSVRNERLGTASALIATQRQVGMSLGMAIAGTIYTTRKARHLIELTGKGLEAAQAARKAIPLSFHDALLVSACILSLVVLLCLATWNRNKD